MSVRILIGDVRTKLAELAADSVDCVVTSPPYWGLRDYGVDGQIGMERTLGEHLSVMVEVFDLVRRVMKPEGTLWLNYGDCYATKPNGRSAADTKAAGNDDRTFRDKPFSTVGPIFDIDHKDGGSRGTNKGNGATGPGRICAGGVLKPKDLCLVPNRLAQALQEPRYLGDIKRLEDRVWLAAIIDGEGSIFVHRQPAGTQTGRGRQYVRTQDNFCVGIAICNTSAALIDHVIEILGGNSHRRLSKGNRRDHFEFRITGNKAKQVLREVYPFLVAKRQEARIAMACPPSGDLAAATWCALKVLHKTGSSDFDCAAPKDDLWGQGWWVRSEIVWGKPNPMPDSSGRYRPSTAHEKLFLLSKSAKCHYDSEAVRMPASENTHARLSQDVQNQIGSERANGGRKTNGNMKAVGRKFDSGPGNRNNPSFDAAMAIMPDNRLLRNYEPDLSPIIPPEVWQIATAAFSEAHFATFPPALVVPCILAGCHEGGTVLDPFFGAGTTGLVADRLGRSCIGIELNAEYAELARKRLLNDCGLFADISVEMTGPSTRAA